MLRRRLDEKQVGDHACSDWPLSLGDGSRMSRLLLKGAMFQWPGSDGAPAMPLLFSAWKLSWVS